jgi:asparagine synthase (glutamine-hydrolysing)
MYFPEYFERIPWEKTGLPITTSDMKKNLKMVETKLRRATARVLNKVCSLEINDTQMIADYPAWFRKEPLKTFLISLLLNNNAIYCNYLDFDISKKILNRFLEKKEDNLVNVIGLILTLEIYLQFIFNGGSNTMEKYLIDE